MVDPFFVAERLAEPGPHRRDGRYVHVAILGSIDIGRHAAWVLVSDLLRHHAVNQIARRLEIEHEGLRFEERCLNPLALPGFVAFDQSGESTIGREQSRYDIGDWN